MPMTTAPAVRLVHDAGHVGLEHAREPDLSSFADAFCGGRSRPAMARRERPGRRAAPWSRPAPARAAVRASRSRARRARRRNGQEVDGCGRDLVVDGRGQPGAAVSRQGDGFDGTLGGRVPRHRARAPTCRRTARRRRARADRTSRAPAAPSPSPARFTLTTTQASTSPGLGDRLEHPAQLGRCHGCQQVDRIADDAASGTSCAHPALERTRTARRRRDRWRTRRRRPGSADRRRCRSTPRAGRQARLRGEQGADVEELVERGRRGSRRCERTARPCRRRRWPGRRCASGLHAVPPSIGQPLSATSGIRLDTVRAIRAKRRGSPIDSRYISTTRVSASSAQ